MPHIAMHVNTGRRLDQPTRYQPLASVVLTIVTGEELKKQVVESDIMRCKEVAQSVILVGKAIEAAIERLENDNP